MALRLVAGVLADDDIDIDEAGIAPLDASFCAYAEGMTAAAVTTAVSNNIF
jgi:hypothetical protein